MSSQNGSEWKMPPVELGDEVLYYSSPLDMREPSLGWICRRPGACNVNILTFSADQGFIEKHSVRHADDPGLQENAAWRQWGCYKLHPRVDLLKKLESLLPQVVTLLARSGGKKGD